MPICLDFKGLISSLTSQLERGKGAFRATPWNSSSGDGERKDRRRTQTQCSWRKHHFAEMSSMKPSSAYEEITRCHNAGCWQAAGQKNGLDHAYSVACMPRTLAPSQPSCRVQSAPSWVLTHLWDLWAQRVPPDPLAQAVLAPPWGLLDLEAHLFQGALGARVCLERPWCALRASGPGGRRVWLWSRKKGETVHEGGLPQRQDGSSLPSSALGRQ